MDRQTHIVIIVQTQGSCNIEIVPFKLITKSQLDETVQADLGLCCSHTKYRGSHEVAQFSHQKPFRFAMLFCSFTISWLNDTVNSGLNY